VVAQLDSDDFRQGSNFLLQSAGTEKDAFGDIFCAALVGKATPKKKKKKKNLRQ
jgi:hypothetical protein